MKSKQNYGNRAVLLYDTYPTPSECITPNNIKPLWSLGTISSNSLKAVLKQRENMFARQSSFKKNTFNFHSLLAPYMEILELPALSKQVILPTAILAFSRHFPVQVFLSKITFLCWYVQWLWVHALRGQSKAWGTLLYCSLPINLPQGMLLNQLGPSELLGSIISTSWCWGYWHSQPLGVLIGVLGTLTRVLMFAKASALTHSQNFFLTCIMHACWSFNGSIGTQVHLISGSLVFWLLELHMPPLWDSSWASWDFPILSLPTLSTRQGQAPVSPGPRS